ncbi:GNAT family N-acetyltransferase [Ornithinibacillus sp. JPR2-1]|uniref:GNAT family N-acetyltransferase n=1 Tax=Ornithinibacillus sp. JPR2-1 TaxID=2094019 RepID=UPI0031E01514
MDIKIVKYDESYAARVAEMWNHSRDGWGGANTVDTEESVLLRERNSTNIHTFLALEGDKVVGYCGFSEYRDDEGALYIPLLNVRDDYHGKKIGKQLLLTALEEAIHLKWPRLDLYTWPGNTKAVPLYKRCGFFWEERDDTTHLMNFMPTVLHTEAVADFFKDANWYDISTREIEVKPDGRVENEFHYYEYAWKKENQTLRMEFERTGRGIRLIETDDYYIAATIPEHQLVFGNHYPIQYTIKNKSAKALQVELKGENDKNIEYSIEKSINVTDEIEVVENFYIHPIEEEQNSLRTHPSVKTKIRINGKEATFKLGILPKYPAQVTAHYQEDIAFLGNENIFYLDIVNNYSEKIHFEVTFPDSPIMEIKAEKIQLEMNPKERKSVPVPFIVTGYGFYEAALPIKAIKENGEIVEFSRFIGIPIRGIGAKFFGIDEEMVHLYNGQYFAVLNKKDNTIDMGRKKQESSIQVMTPKLGKPYSEEMAKAKYNQIQFMDENGTIGAKISYEIAAFPSITLHLILKLSSEGLVENYYEVENKREVETAESIFVNQPIYFGLEKAVIPYQGEMVEMTDSIGNSYEYWKDTHITENWIFAKEGSDPLGICWDSTSKIHFDSWFHYFEHDLGKIGPRSSLVTKPVVFSLGAFHDIESFRAYANKASFSKKVKPVNHVRLSLQNNNPFLQGGKGYAKVTDYKSNYLHGEISLSHLNQEELVVGKIDRKEKKTEWIAELSANDIPSISTVKVKASLDATIQDLETLVISHGKGECLQEIENVYGMDSWRVNNGVVEIKATPEFFPALHSLTYKGHEWLDSSFPKLQPNLWWNPWAGGISSRLTSIRPYSLSKETTKADFAKLVDNKGNEWQGIKLSTIVEQNKEYKGLTMHQYFLLLPGAPILCHVSEIEQHTGKLFHDKAWQSIAFVKPDAVMANNWVNLQDKAGNWMKVVAGKDENDISVDRNMIIGCHNSKEHLQFISNVENTKREMYINKQVMLTSVWERLYVPTGSTYFTTPNFYLFNDFIINDKAQHDLQEISFHK